MTERKNQTQGDECQTAAEQGGVLVAVRTLLWSLSQLLMEYV